MSNFNRRLVACGLCCVLVVGVGSAVAQTNSPSVPSASATKPSAGKTPAAKVEGLPSQATKTPETFERTQRLEDMRYRHLWIAYGAIWLIIFFFVLRTWKLNQATTSELERLKARLADLESNNGAS